MLLEKILKFWKMLLSETSEMVKPIHCQKKSTLAKIEGDLVLKRVSNVIGLELGAQNLRQASWDISILEEKKYKNILTKLFFLIFFEMLSEKILKFSKKKPWNFRFFQNLKICGFFFRKFYFRFFLKLEKTYFFSELRNFLGYSFDVKKSYLSIYEVFSAIWAR